MVIECKDDDSERSSANKFRFDLILIENNKLNAHFLLLWYAILNLKRKFPSLPQQQNIFNHYCKFEDKSMRCMLVNIRIQNHEFSSAKF